VDFPIKVSIIIPTYNTAQLLDRAITSAFNQTLKDIEVIVVDDHSTDNTIDILKKYESDKRFKYKILEQNQGPGAARNAALELAKGEFVGFIDSDDYVSDKYFESLYTLSKDKDVVFGIFVNSTNDTNNYSRHGKFEETGYGCVGDTIWRKSFLDKYKIRFDGNSKMGEDLNFRTTVMNHKPRKIRSPDVGAYYFYKRREGSLMNYDPKYLESLTNKSTLDPNKHYVVYDSTKVIIIIVSALLVMGVASVFIVRKYKTKHEMLHVPLDESENLITAI
jgi:glycosyltransferase involved in cell wall biosynthesis